MAIRMTREIVQVTLPSGNAAQELMAELTLDLGLEVRLIHGRMSETGTRLTLELAGDPWSVREGSFRCGRSPRPPFVRAS